MRHLATALAALALGATASAQVDLQFKPLVTVDLASTATNTNPEFIGSNPSAVLRADSTTVLTPGTIRIPGGTSRKQPGLADDVPTMTSAQPQWVSTGTRVVLRASTRFRTLK